MTTVVATDLDGTLLFSQRAMAAGSRRPPAKDLVPVDVEGGRTYAYMTTAVIRDWARLAGAGALVPATTRSVPQYRRLRLPGPPPHIAIVCNGARLLVGGEAEPAWEHRVRRRMRGGVAFDVVWREATGWYHRHPFAALRAVEDLFMYLTVRERADWLTDVAAQAAAWAGGVGWRASLQGRKLYLLPRTLDKAAAVAHAAERLAADRLVAGGDSLLDAGMLRAADAAIRPAHGELHSTGFALPHCRTTREAGAAAGDEIIAWYGSQIHAARLAI
ncbi:HAD family hydrolase [Spirilliplanes yamanashiensis]|uniref:HAD family hydrolase n=1 Tax=Spirilliplanes yamanashiensis TaxID=42233 RepID=A0A8J3Y758_9ACTN|nr:HAD family hydrolase [Spirilliplanes yamanashiensis]MDP9817210.1 hypothetical protein [Spirilliplanes yamanashiensis]GIJ03136.1 hypothetical protein Sya03_24880 [Spirilliplanes yamanashiensis]